ncbi:MAG: four helix bundle protein [Bacteroidota bacterium]
MNRTERPHKKLIVWQEAMELVSMVYHLCIDFPTDEKFGMISQMKRAAVSVPSNIAEGAARKSNKETIQFFYISLGSLSELDTLNTLAKILNFINENKFNDLDEKINRVSALLNGLIEKRKSFNPHSFITSFLHILYV